MKKRGFLARVGKVTKQIYFEKIRGVNYTDFEDYRQETGNGVRAYKKYLKDVEQRNSNDSGEFNLFDLANIDNHEAEKILSYAEKKSTDLLDYSDLDDLDDLPDLVDLENLDDLEDLLDLDGIEELDDAFIVSSDQPKYDRNYKAFSGMIFLTKESDVYYIDAREGHQEVLCPDGKKRKVNYVSGLTRQEKEEFENLLIIKGMDKEIREIYENEDGEYDLAHFLSERVKNPHTFYMGVVTDDENYPGFVTESPIRSFLPSGEKGHYTMITQIAKAEMNRDNPEFGKRESPQEYMNSLEVLRENKLISQFTFEYVFESAKRGAEDAPSNINHITGVFPQKNGPYKLNPETTITIMREGVRDIEGFRWSMFDESVSYDPWNVEQHNNKVFVSESGNEMEIVGGPDGYFLFSNDNFNGIPTLFGGFDENAFYEFKKESNEIGDIEDDFNNAAKTITDLFLKYSKTPTEGNYLSFCIATREGMISFSSKEKIAEVRKK
jgi:hypothetical protein